MADPHNVEFEAAKFLQKLIHESTDEPSKLATKLYVILQHMKASGKENSMPYQVISRAMETVINQNNLDIDALMSSRLPQSSGSHGGETARAQSAGCSQSVGGAIDSKSGLLENDNTRPDGFGSGRPPAALSSVGNDPFQGSVSQRNAMSFDHESPSSMETRSTNSHSQDRRDPPGWDHQGVQKDPKRANIKRKRADSSGMETQDDISQQLDSHSGIPDVRKERFSHRPEGGGTLPVDSESWKQGLFKGSTSFRERGVPGPPSAIQVDASRNLTSASSLDTAGISHIPVNVDRLSQGGNSSNLCEVGIPASSASRDKYHAIPASGSSMPFKEHHLKQLRAQCLVFLAFRNGVPPKKLHLEIALGNMLPREGSSNSVEGAQNELIQDKGKHQPTLASSSISEVPLPHGNMVTVKSDGAPVSSAAFSIREADMILKGPENVKPVVGVTGSLANLSHMDEEKKHNLVGHGIQEADTENPETANSSVLMTASMQTDTLGMRNPATHIHEENLQPGAANNAAALMGLNKQLKPEMSRWSRVNHNDISRGTLPAFQHDLGSSNDSSIFSQYDNNIQNQQRANSQMSTSWKSIQPMDSGDHRGRPVNDASMLLRNALHDGNGSLDNQTRIVPDGSKVGHVSDSSYMFKDSSSLAPMEKLPEPEEGGISTSANLLPSPKYTLSEKWIMAHQKKKIATEQKWVQKLQKADQRIATCFSELKETVSSSADISAKTRSVIELKKLQLLELQRCLRSNILSDFFKPIQTEMDRLKSIKKHRIGRRLKHVEKYEQKMKEERQKRIRERQKEFFSEVEVHKERLEDLFKYKRERCKSFNRYVKEYNKRKERIHREKIDRIQREKINLLKINDVEGYLRMVQDAKSDRVNKLLKETEKYLQKLGSRLKEAKAAARQVEMDDRVMTDDISDIFTETEDENDQAKHYKESNEKYYLIAHSIKENIAEQPTGLRGGKLREYQMNGLRWLVSLYNNHLNGILADEMGLGKTVQVISLICYLMETKNDRGPFLVVVPSSVLPGWENEMNFWAPGINKIVYAGPPEERRRLFKESIVHQKFNVLLTTYEYLMNKHDRPKLSKIHWHYIIIDEGHRIKNASCKLNADLKYYNSSHRLLLTGTPLQNNLEELWALLNFLLPNIFNSSEDFSQWFNKPFESNGDNSPDETLLSEEENLLIINRLHQVLRPFVLRRLKHKVENELPEKIERLVRCEASAYQKLLMKRVEENLGSLGVSKSRAVHNSVMELRNICNHPYLSQLHTEEVESYIPKHYLPPIVRLCGKLEMLDRLLPKLKETNHRVLFFSTMTRLLDVMEDYLVWKKYRYLRLDGHTSGLDRGALIDKFNQPDSPFFIFLLSIRAGGVGVNLQAADTVIIFDTDWNPQVDLQAQARAHRIGQKKDVLVLRLETVNSVEEQVRAAAEHKLGVANQSITAGFFDNNTSAEDRREYLESLLRESKKEEAAPVLDDDSLNDILARSEAEIDVFEAVDQKRREEEMATWKRLASEKEGDGSDAVLLLPSRLVTDDDLTSFYEAMKVHDIPNDDADSSSGIKGKSRCLGGFDTQQYGRGKRAREVRSYEEQWTEEEFEKMCQAESPENPKPKDEKVSLAPENISVASENISLAPESSQTTVKVEPSLQAPQAPPPSLELLPHVKREATPPVKRGRGRPRRLPSDPPAMAVSSTTIGVSKFGSQMQKEIISSTVSSSGPCTVAPPVVTKDASGDSPQVGAVTPQSSLAVPPLPSVDPVVQSDPSNASVATQPKRQGRKGQSSEKNIDGNSGTESVKRRGRKPGRVLSPVPSSSHALDSKLDQKPQEQLSSDTLPVHSSNPLADSGSASRPSCLGRCADTAVEDAKDSTLVAKETLSDVLGQESAAVQNPKPNDQSTMPAILDSSSVAVVLPEASAVSKGDHVSKDQVVSVSASLSVAPIVGTLSSPKPGTELPRVSPQAGNPSSELALPTPVGLRPGRRQSQKPQSGIEPVRRRGRKRGRIDTDIASSDVQDKNMNEPGNNIGSQSYYAVPNAVTSSAPANVAMDPRIATVPVIPPVPVSGFMPSATPLIGNSVHHVSKGLENSMPASSQQSLLSGTPDMPPGVPKLPVPLPPQGQDEKIQAGETAPRRRGRKKNAASPGDSTGGQNLSSRQTNRSSGDFVERKVIATRSRQINIPQSDSSLAEANTRDTSIALCSNNLVGMQSSILPSQVNPSNLGSASVDGVGASKQAESRLANLRGDAAVCRIPVQTPPVTCKGKTNVIVLALELTTPDTDTTGSSCSNADGKEECSNLQKNSARDVLLAVEIQAPTQDDELAAPPGFDTPRIGVSDTVVKKSFQSDDCGTPKISDAKRGSVVLALESTALTVEPCSGACEKMPEEQEYSESHRIKDSVMRIMSPSEPIGCEPGSESVDKMANQSEEEMSAPPGFDIPQRCISDNAVAMSSESVHGSASDMQVDIVSTSKAEKYSQEPNDGHSEKDIRVPDSTSAVAPTLGSKEEDLLRGSDGAGELETVDASADSLKLESDTQTILTCVSAKKEEYTRPDDNGGEVESNIGAAPAFDVAGSHMETTLTLESKDKLACHGSDAGNAPTASPVVDLDAKAVSPLETKREERCEPNHSNIAYEAGNALEVVSAVCSDTVVASISDSKEIEESLGPDITNTEGEADDVGYNTMASSNLETKQKEKCHESDNTNAEHGAANVVFDVVASSSLEAEEKVEFHEIDNANAGSSSVNVLSDTVPSSLKFREKEECHEPGNANTKIDTDTVVMNALATSSLDSKDEDICQELDTANARNDSENVVSDMVASQGLESEANEEFHEPDNGNAVNDADIVVSSTLDLKEKEGSHELDNANAGDNTDSVVSNTTISSILEVKEKEKCREPDNANTGNDADKVISDAVASSSLELKENEECQEPDNTSAGNDASNVVSAVAASSSFELQESKEYHGPVDGKDENDANNMLPDSIVASSESAVTSPLESKENTELHGHSDVGVGLDVDDTQTALAEDFKEKPNSPCPEDGAVELDAIQHVALNISLGADNEAASMLESKEKQECLNEPDSGVNKCEAVDAYTAPLVDSNVVATSSLGSKETEEYTAPPVDSNVVATSSLGSQETEEYTAPLVDSNVVATSSLGSKETEESHEIKAGNIEQDGGDALATSHVVTDESAASTMK